MIITSRLIFAYFFFFLLLTSPIYYNVYYYISINGTEKYIIVSTFWICSVIMTNSLLLLITGFSLYIDEIRNNRHRLLNNIL